jgi:hypothetical protein
MPFSVPITQVKIFLIFIMIKLTDDGYRKRKYAAVKALTVSTGKSKTTQLTFSSLLKDMKNQWGSTLGFKTPAFAAKHNLSTPSSKDIDYIFVKPAASKIKNEKERRIWENLDKLGVFQVNLNVILKEYSHTKMS